MHACSNLLANMLHWALCRVHLSQATSDQSISSLLCFGSELLRSSSQKSLQEEMPTTVARWEAEVTFAKRFVPMYPAGVL